MPSRSIDHAFTTRQTVGAASDPTYAGALSFMRRKISKDAAGVDAVVWGIPFDAAVSNRPGARFGPQAIRRASAIFDNDPQYPFSRDLFESMSVDRLWRLPARLRQSPEDARRPSSARRRRSCKSGAFLLSLGGDHFVTWPLLKAHAAMHGPLALVQFDAHQDTWFDDGRRIDHGSFVARAVRDGVDRSRPLDPDRHPHPRAGGLRHPHPLWLRSRGHARRPTSPMRSPSAPAARRPTSPSTSTASIPPMRPAPARRLRAARRRRRSSRCCGKLGHVDIVGADIVEVAPAYDHADITAIAAATVAMYVLGLLAEQKARKRRWPLAMTGLVRN